MPASPLLGPVILGGLTTLIGNFFINRQNQISKQREFREAELKMAKEVFNEVSISMDSLCTASRDAMWALVLRPDCAKEWKPEDHEAWKTYSEGLTSWKKSRARNIALTRKYFGTDAADRLKKIQECLEDLEDRIDSNYYERKDGRKFMKKGNASFKDFLKVSDQLHETEVVALTELMIDRLQKQEVGALRTTNI